MNFDSRISKVDSEWDQDSDSDSNKQNVYIQNTQAFYDVVPRDSSPLGGIQTSSSPQMHSISKNTASKKSKRDFKNSTKLPCALKLYLAFLSVLVLLLVGSVTFITMKGNFLQPENKTTLIQSTANTSSFSMEIASLKNQLNKTQNMVAALQTRLSKGCESEIQLDSTCYTIHLVSSVLQIVAAGKCSALHSNGFLAKVNSLQIKMLLSYYLPAGGLWIDGFRSAANGLFHFKDGSLYTSNLTENQSNKTGKCLSFVKDESNSTVRITECNDSLKGFICQYRVLSQ